MASEQVLQPTRQTRRTAALHAQHQSNNPTPTGDASPSTAAPAVQPVVQPNARRGKKGSGKSKGSSDAPAINPVVPDVQAGPVPPHDTAPEAQQSQQSLAPRPPVPPAGFVSQQPIPPPPSPPRMAAAVRDGNFVNIFATPRQSQQNDLPPVPPQPRPTVRFESDRLVDDWDFYLTPPSQRQPMASTNDDGEDLSNLIRNLNTNDPDWHDVDSDQEGDEFRAPPPRPAVTPLRGPGTPGLQGPGTPGRHIPAPIFGTPGLGTPGRRIPNPLFGTPGRPRFGPHSTVTRERLNATGRTGSKKGSSTRDVSEFFTHDATLFPNKPVCCCFCLRDRKAGKVLPRADLGCYSEKTDDTPKRKHLGDHHLHEWIPECERRQLPLSTKTSQTYANQYHGRSNPTADSTGREGIPAFSQAALVEAIMELIVSDDQSLNLVENKKFRRLLLLCREEMKDSDIPHRSTIRNRILEAVQEYQEELKAELQTAVGKVSFTMDMWTDLNLTPFMAITAHWIECKVTENTTTSTCREDYNFRAELISFQRVPGSHTGHHMATAFIHVVRMFGIAHKVGWITMDNATNNDTFATSFARQLRNMGGKFDGTSNRIRCFPHIINLAAKAILAAVTELKRAAANAPNYTPPDDFASMNMEDVLQRDPIAIVRTVIRVIRASSLRRQDFARALADLGLPNLELLRDVETRWSSTYFMLARACQLRQAIDTFLEGREELQRYVMNDYEWKAVEMFRDILKIPAAFQQSLSAEKTPSLGLTLDCFERVKTQLKQLQEKYSQDIDTSELVGFVQAGINKIEEYQFRIDEVPAYRLALMLDPGSKLEDIEEIFGKDEGARAKQLLLSELERYYRPDAAAASNPNPPSNWAGNTLGRRRDRAQAAQQARPLAAEVNNYLHSEPEFATNLVQWWVDNRHKFPTIFLLAMDILPIQGSAVPCERVFSSAKETMTPRRSRLGADMMEACQLLKFKLKHVPSLNFTAGTSEEDELLALEAYLTFNTEIPDDISAFTTHLAHRSTSGAPVPS